jgi:hypothetical protein
MRSIRMIFSVVFVFLFVALPAWAQLNGVPDPTLSTAWMADQGPEPLTLMITPDGTGGYFSEARTPDGTLADATITLLLMDFSNTPIGYFPREDLWIQAENGGIAFCGIYDLWADDDTGPDGQTIWSQRPRGGGYSEGPMIVYVNGTPLSGTPLELYFNSPDISSDGRVSLGDVTFFAIDFYGGFHFRSDLHRDGVINLSDVTPLAKWMGRVCE